MMLWRTNGNYAKNLLEPGLLKRFHRYGDVHVMRIEAVLTSIHNLCFGAKIRK